MKIYLDDLRPTPVGWAGCKSVNDAINLIEYIGPDAFEALSLDHDLGDFAGEGGDGYKLIDWIAETGNWPQTKPTVHSMNPVGIQRIQGVIDTYGPY